MSSDVRRLLLPVWGMAGSSTLKADVLAGVTVSLVAVPQSLAYAQLAGMPPVCGLYAAFIPTLIGALAGSSPILSTGPVAMTSLLTAASLAPLAAKGTEQFYLYAVLLALLSGLFQLAFGLMRMGVLLNFLSHPVLMGFINAAAIIIGLSQMPMLLGIPTVQSEHFVLDIFNLLLRIREADPLTVALGFTSLISLAIFKSRLPKWPGVLITVTGLTIFSATVGYETLGGRVVGVIPQGLPSFGLPPIDLTASVALLPSAFVMALISFMEAMSSSKIIAIRTRTRWDENRELIGQGLAKVAAAFCLSMPVSGSFSRSALNLSAGAKTKLSSIVAAAFVFLTLLFLTPLLHHLPKAVLAAIIMMAVTNLVNVRIIRNAWQANYDDGFAGTITFIATLLFAPNIQNGILTGILLSLALMLYRLMKPRVAILGVKKDSTLHEGVNHAIEPLGPRLGAIRFDGALLFINVSYFEDALIELERNNRSLSHILVKCSGVNRIDASGVEMLFNLIERFKSSGITLVFSGLKEQTLDVMRRSGLVRAIGPENLFVTDKEALSALRELWDPYSHASGAEVSDELVPGLVPLAAFAGDKRDATPARRVFTASGSGKILVPVDGSTASMRAVEAAIQMAGAHPGSSLVLFNAQSPINAEAPMGEVFVSRSLELLEQQRIAQLALQPAIELCQLSETAYEVRKGTGPTAALIVKVASEEKADQIVMGTNSEVLLAGRWRRSLSSQVIEQAGIPVTVIK